MTTSPTGKTKATGAKGKTKVTDLKEFLSNLAKDAQKLGEFLHKPEEAMSAANLSEEDKTALRSGVAGMVHARLAGVPLDQAFRPVYLQKMMYMVHINHATREVAPMIYHQVGATPAPMIHYIYQAPFEPLIYHVQAAPMVHPMKVTPQFAVHPPPQYVVYPPQYVVHPPPQYVVYPPQYVVQPPPQYVVYPPQFVAQWPYYPQ